MADPPSCCELAKATFTGRAEDLRWAATRLPMAGDLEAVHDVRVALRRLGEAGRAFRCCAVPGSGRSAGERRQLERRLGPLRDAEVRLQLLDQVLGPLAVWRDRSDDPRLVGEGSYVVVPQLADRLRPGLRGLETHARRLLADRTSEQIERRRGRRLTPAALELLQRLASVPVLDTGHPGSGPALHLARQQLPPLFGAAARRGADLHRRRIRLRRLRYRVEVFAPALPGGHEPVLQELRRLQQLLGQLHDQTVLAGWIRRRARRERPELRPALRRLSVRAALEEQASAEAAARELARLDAARWWETAQAAALA